MRGKDEQERASSAVAGQATQPTLGDGVKVNLHLGEGEDVGLLKGATEGLAPLGGETGLIMGKVGEQGVWHGTTRRRHGRGK